MEAGFSSFPQAKFDEFIKRLQDETPKLPKQEARLAQFVSLNISSLGLETGKSLAEKAGFQRSPSEGCCAGSDATA